jgi:hypothetical protein
MLEVVFVEMDFTKERLHVKDVLKIVQHAPQIPTAPDV